MTSLTTSPLLVSLLQTAASTAIFTLALPAGALADIVDRRRLLIAGNIGAAATAALLAAASWRGVVSPELLLAFTFVLGAGAAVTNPAWQAIVPDVVPARLVPSALTLNGVNINLARALGPALGGFVVAAAGAPAVFALNALATTVMVVVMWRWRDRQRTRVAPVERFTSAMTAGLRFVRFSRELRPVLIRAFTFIVCGSAVWALLPVLARHQLGLGATEYGFLLGALGAGAVLASNFLPAWRRRLDVDRIVIVASLALGGLLAVLSINRSYPIALGLMFLVGMAWIALMPTFNVAAMQAVPPWVRARGLAIYSITYQGGTAVGGIVWGLVATVADVQTALMMAGGGLGAGVLLAPLFPMRRIEDVDQSPAGHWPTIEGLIPASESEAGPVLVTVEYTIEPVNRGEFLQLAHAGRPIRQRDGAYAWGIYEDTEDPSRFVEEFLIATWSEHMRQHERVTKHDQDQEAVTRAFHIGSERPRVHHYLYAQSARQSAGQFSRVVTR